jgi:hypothetical protein
VQLAPHGTAPIAAKSIVLNLALSEIVGCLLSREIHHAAENGNQYAQFTAAHWENLTAPLPANPRTRYGERQLE